MSIRVFVAIEIDKGIKDKICEYQNKLKKSNAGVKWIAPENIHLTLRFLGHIEEGHLDGLKKVIHDAILDVSPFTIKIEKVGAFPSTRRPRVIFVCVNDISNNLLNIFNKLNENMEGIGIQKETKNFVSHITIGRTKSQKNIAKLKKDLNSGDNHFFGEEDVSSIALIQSKLTPTGAIYTKLKNFIVGKK